MHLPLKDRPGQVMLMLGNEAIARGAIEADPRVGLRQSALLSFRTFALELGIYFLFPLQSETLMYPWTGCLTQPIRTVG